MSMIDEILNWLTPILILIIGFFLRDLYNFIKGKFVKGKRPKITIDYDFYNSGASRTNPRIYFFRSSLKVQNIDSEPLYNLLLGYNDGPKTEIKKLKLLSSTKDFEIRNTVEVPFGGQGDNPKGAPAELEQRFKRPQLIMKYEDKNGHKFKEYLNKKWVLSNTQMALSWNEIKDRALKFSNKKAEKTKERAEKDSFWNEFFNALAMQLLSERSMKL